MLTEFKVALTAAIGLVVFFVAFAVHINERPYDDTTTGVLALLCIISFVTALFSLTFGIWQL